MALDTLAYARKLREAGFSEQQAEGQAEALSAAMTDTLATRQDVLALGQNLREVEVRLSGAIAGEILSVRHDMRELEMRLRHEMRETESRMEVRLADLERRMTMRLGGLMMAGIAIVSALDRLG